MNSLNVNLKIINSANPQSSHFRQRAGRSDVERFVTTRLIAKFTARSLNINTAPNAKNNSVNKNY